MTVAELIEKLKEMPQDARVVKWQPQWESWIDVEDVELVFDFPAGLVVNLK